MSVLYHGGVPDLKPGDTIEPGHSRDNYDDCPICHARREKGASAIDSQPPLWFPTEPPAEQEKNLWRNMGTCDAQDEWLDKARDPLEIARKAVSE